MHPEPTAHKSGRSLPLLAVALWGIVMSWEMKSGWEVLAGITAAAVFAISIYAEFVRPQIRKHKLKSPCRAYFHIRELGLGALNHMVQDDRAHNVKELVLPSNSLVEIEIAYVPLIEFRVEETVFGCEGQLDSKPIVEEPITPFVAKGELPASPNYWDRNGYYHYRSPNTGRSIGSCYTKGFKLKTQRAGTYKVMLGFMTNEIDGSAWLYIKVEDKPKTRMRCIEHRDCHVHPLISKL